MIKTFTEYLSEADEYLTRFRDNDVDKIISISGFSEEYSPQRVQKYLSKVHYETTLESPKDRDPFLVWKSSNDKSLNQVFTNLTLKLKNSGFKGLKVWKSMPKGEPQFTT